MNTRTLKAMLTAVLFAAACAGAPAWSQATVDINTATVEQLTQLKGIGEKTALKVIEYREANGPFKTPEDITSVPGIGQKLLENNKGAIVVGE